METAAFQFDPAARLSVRRKYQIPDSAVVFGTIARLQPLKGHDDILSIAGSLIQLLPDIHFMWIGDGVYFERFSRTIAENNWQKYFTLTGLVPPEEVGSLISAIDVLIHPSYREGLPRAVPQAMLAARPTIVYDCDGAGEVCIDSRTGILVKPGDREALDRAVRRLATNAELRTQWGLAGKDMAEREFSATDMVDRLETLYQRLMTGDETK
jgi:glycosyltransferase involved in cell wall biosynthesis